jgi:uncharacterized protein YdcH (DUF465 family)
VLLSRHGGCQGRSSLADHRASSVQETQADRQKLNRIAPLPSHGAAHEEERMASVQRNPRDVLFDADAEYQRLAEEHSKYEAELQNILKAPYLSSEDLLEEIKLKKMKLQCKDEMERIAARIQYLRAKRTQ